jgi:hypothetical protein
MKFLAMKLFFSKGIFAMLILALLFSFSCTKSGFDTGEIGSVKLIGAETLKTEKLIDNDLIKKSAVLLNEFDSQKSNERNVLKRDTDISSLNFDLSNASITRYKGTNTRLIVVPQQGSNDPFYQKSFITFSDGKMMLNTGIILEQLEKDGLIYTKYFKPNGDLVASYTLKGNEVISSFFVEEDSMLRASSFWKRFTGCLKRTIDEMSDGNPGNTVVAVLCIAFGPQCAGSMTVLCTFAAGSGFEF